MQRFKLDRSVLRRHHQKQRAFLVAQEQVLGVAAGHLAAQRAGLLDGEHRRMAHSLVGNAETIQISEQFVRRYGRHVPRCMSSDSKINFL